MTLTAAVLELAIGATARAFVVSVATSLAQSALLALLGRACPAPAPASPRRRTVTDRRDGPRKDRRATPRVSGSRSRRRSRPRRAAGAATGRGPGDQAARLTGASAS
jgi:hypothetical protein